MPHFHHHPSFVSELEDFINKHCSNSNFDQTIQATENLLTNQIYNKNQVLTKNMFGRASSFGSYPVYWLKLIIPNSGLRSSQHPKCYLYADEKHLGFLCCDSHLENYEDSELRKTASKRIGELLEYFKSCCGH